MSDVPSLAQDLLEGADAIAAELGWSRRKVYDAYERKLGWPIWKDGSLFSTRSALRNYVAMRAQAALNRGSQAA
jgi:hypothetical protein